MSSIKTGMKTKALVVLACGLFSFASISAAQEMTAENYIALDLEARQVTLEGVWERLVLLQLGADLSLQLQHDAQTQQKVEAIYAEAGTTLAKTVVWATHNTQAINRWLARHPDVESEYARINRELDEASAQIESFQTNQQGD